MAKVSYSKLNLKINTDVKEVEWLDQKIEVKQYLPAEQKLELISKVINDSADDNNFFNPVKIELFGNLEIINYYTNIVFTDKQKEDLGKLYDSFVSSGLLDKIILAIPEAEYKSLITGITDCAESIYKYVNSAMAIIDNLKDSAINDLTEAEGLQKQIADPDNLKLVKDILTKLN